MSHRNIAAHSTNNYGVPPAKQEDDDNETLNGGYELYESDIGIDEAVGRAFAMEELKELANGGKVEDDLEKVEDRDMLMDTDALDEANKDLHVVIENIIVSEEAEVLKPGLKEELTMYAVERRCEDCKDAPSSTPQQQHRGIIDTTMKIEVADSGRSSSRGASDSIKDFVAMIETTLDPESNMDSLWKTPTPMRRRLDALSPGSSGWDGEVGDAALPSYVDNAFSGLGEVVSGFNLTSAITTTNGDGDGNKACDEEDKDEAAEDVLPKSLTDFVTDIETELAGVALDDAPASECASSLIMQLQTAEKKRATVCDGHDEEFLFSFDENEEDSLRPVQQPTTVGIKSSTATVLFPAIRFGAKLHPTRNYSATLVTKHIRGYLARRKVAHLVHRAGFALVAYEAASTLNVKTEVSDDDEPAGSAQNVANNITNLSAITDLDDADSFTFSLSTIQDSDSRGDGLALENTAITSWSLKSQAGTAIASIQASTDDDLMNHLALEFLKSILLSEEEGGSNDRSEDKT